MYLDKIKCYQRDKKIGEMLTFLVFISLSFLSYVPNLENTTTLVFMIFFCSWVIFGIFCIFTYRAITFQGLFSFFGLLLVILINFIIASINYDIQITNWLRAFSSIGFYFSLFIIPLYIRLIGSSHLVAIVYITCHVYCLRLLAFDLDGFIQAIQTGARVTLFINDSVIPFPLIGLILTCLLPKRSRTLRCSSFILFSFFIFLVGYNMQILFVISFLTVLSLSKLSIPKKILAITVMILCVIIVLSNHLTRNPIIGKKGDQVRLLEIKYAWKSFEQSPIFGSSLGVKIPKTHVYSKSYDNSGESDHKNYIHNFILYILMTGGLSFFIFVLYFLIYYRVLWVKSYFKKCNYKLLSSWSVLALFLFSITSASFKQIPTILLLCTFLSLKKHFSNENKRIIFK